MCRSPIRDAVLIILLVTASELPAAQNAPVPKCKTVPISANSRKAEEQSPYRKAKKILSDAARNYSVSVTHVCELKQIDQPISILTEFLEDKELASWAILAMMKIDPVAAAPILAQKTQEPLDAQEIFKFYYDLGLVNPMPWRADLHQLALRELEAGRNSREAVYVLGLTGDAKDIPLLEQIYARGDEPASEAALARLGSSFHLNNIEMKLRMTLALETEETEKFNHAMEASRAIQAAGFSGNERFIPLLCSHLQDPGAVLADQMACPSWEAVDALALIIDHKLLPGVITPEDHQQWQDRCDALKR